MTGKSDRLKRVASDLLCGTCQLRPRLGNIARCRECLRIDTERELAARPQLLAGKGSPKPKRTSGRKQPATAPLAPASNALTVVARPTPPAVVPSVVAEPMGELGKPYTLAQWQTLITQTLRRWRAAGTVAQNRMAEQILAAQTVAENVAVARVTYGPNTLITLRPPSNSAGSAVHWALERMGVRFDLVDVFGDITDVRTICQFCDAKVRRPCNESRARNCANRSRGNR
jgi:hypothetical protein